MFKIMLIAGSNKISIHVNHYALYFTWEPFSYESLVEKKYYIIKNMCLKYRHQYLNIEMLHYPPHYPKSGQRP